jgi:hypothetical protein
MSSSDRISIDDAPPSADGTPPPFEALPGGFVVFNSVPHSTEAVIVDATTFQRPCWHITSRTSHGGRSDRDSAR